MPQPIAQRIPVIDADTHIVEPADLWTSRVSKKWGDLVPHVRHSMFGGEDLWVFGGQWLVPVGCAAMAGWPEPFPSHPATMADIRDRACFDATDRVQRMDEYGIHAQVIYPNVGGFGSRFFLQLKEPALMLECVRAYNDFLIEWCSAAPSRLIPIMALPFWDVEASTAEIQRCVKLGHKGILFSSQPDYFEFPKLSDPHWDPLYATAQDLGLSINFHIGSVGELQADLLFIDMIRSVAEVINSGLCDRFPRQNFVMVESGIGWVPYVLEHLEWQWTNNLSNLGRQTHAMTPTEYFRRQVHACFWHERGSIAKAVLREFPDNCLYETDFPHPQSMTPGPGYPAADRPDVFIEKHLSDLPEELLQKVLHDNAARLYNVR